jgi:hypothetical protein
MVRGDGAPPLPELMAAVTRCLGEGEEDVCGGEDAVEAKALLRRTCPPPLVRPPRPRW